MRNIVSTFTEGERNIIVFVFISLALGCGILEWRESQQSHLVFTGPEATVVSQISKAEMPAGMDADGRVNVNKAKAEMLETLPGIGPALAGAMVRHRESNGPFRSMGDLDLVPGIGPAMMAKLSPLINFDDGDGAGAALPSGGTAAGGGIVPGGGAVQHVSAGGLTAASFAAWPLAVADTHLQPAAQGRININKATAAELDALIGVGPALAERILQDRTQRGPFRSAAELDRVKGIGPSILQKNAGLITVE